MRMDHTKATLTDRTGRPRLLRAIALFLAATFAIGLLSACSKQDKPLKTDRISSEDMTVSQPSEYVPALHTIDTQRLEKVASSGLIELYFDLATYAVAVKETSMDQFWYALPTAPASEKENRDVSVFSLEIARGAETYLLNSQDNSVAFGAAEAVPTETGLTVTYRMADTQETALKAEDALDKDDICVTVTVTYTLQDGSLFTSVQLGSLPQKSTARVTKLSLLQYFGAVAQAQADDFILVPDGSGALLYTGIEVQDAEPVSIPVYGTDAAIVSNGEGPAARVGVYGMKQGKSAFAVILEQGDALATIHAEHAQGESGYHHVGASFQLTPELLDATEDRMTRYAGATTYSGEISLCHRFLPGNTATYEGMAIACREQLIRSGVLSTKSVTPEDYLPMNLSVIGAASREKKLLGIWERTVKLTTFSQAQDMVAQMKAKGINNIYLRYQGALSGGLNQKSPISPNLLTRLGGKSDFNALFDYMSAQKLSLYLDVQLVTARKGGISGGKSVDDLQGDRALAYLNNSLAPSLGPAAYLRRLLRPAELEDTTLNLLRSTKRLSLSGYCISDAGSLLYSDPANGIDRQAVAEAIAAQNEPLSMNQKYMVSGGNVYMLKNADVVVDIPLDAFYEETQWYESVPFLQMLLHGILDYSGAPINLQENPVDAALRAVEYGACPSYEWVYDAGKLAEDSASVYQYDQWLTQAARYYEKANAALGDLRDERMTKHEKVQDGVYLTEFGGSSLIYVNYNDAPVTVDGVAVAAKSFIRIN